MTHTGTVSLRVDGEPADEFTHILRPGTDVGPDVRALPSRSTATVFRNWYTRQPRPRLAVRDGRHRIGRSA